MARQCQAPNAVSRIQLVQLILLNETRLWKSKLSAVAEWLYFTFLVNDHHIFHSLITNMVSGDYLACIFPKFTFPSAVSCLCSLPCTFPSLLKLLVQRVRRTFLVAGHQYANQTDKRICPFDSFFQDACSLRQVSLLQCTCTLSMKSYHWGTG